MSGAALLVIAKDPQPGRSKTRLCPPCRPEQAAALAEAALRDTLQAVMDADVDRRVLVLDGDDRRWRAPGLDVIAQRGAGLDERLEHAFADAGGDGPTLLVGMDTPQLTAALLHEGLQTLHRHDAVLGPARDGGYWSVGLRTPRPGGFVGVPMSAADTCARQRERFAGLGLTMGEQSTLTDIDTIEDARVVADLAPGSRFAAALARMAVA